MNWEAIGAIGEILGAAAVVASLIYLGIQTRSNARSLKANAIWNAETVFGDLNFSTARDPAFAELTNRAFAPGADREDFSPIEISQLQLALRGAMQYNQAQWALWQEGMLPDELWERRKTFARGFINIPVLRELWEVELVQQNIAEGFRKEIEDVAGDDSGDA